jgi:site-specific DNA recombinase
MEGALYVRVSTTRQQQTPTIAQQLARLRAYVATQPAWHLAEEPIYRDDGYRGAKLNRPGLDRLRDRAALAAFERVLLTAPIGWPATMSIKCSSSRNSPSGAVRSSSWTGP